MREDTFHGQSRVTIAPGEFHVSTKPMVISTLLGSCVAACLYDPRTRIIGMNHFLLAGEQLDSGTALVKEAGRYGVHAMELLINRMLAAGAARARLQAKAFGGANVLRASGVTRDPIGDVNQRFLRDFLENEQIPLVASDMGGQFGRIIHFFTQEFAVYVQRIRGQAENQILSEEKAFFNAQLKAHAKKQEQGTELW